MSVNDTMNHGNANLLCVSTRWSDILTFFLANYVAHSATVVLFPGEKVLSTVINIGSALLFPAHGIARAVTAIARHASLTSAPLQQAARAGALCMVVRNETWRPRSGDNLQDLIWRGPMRKKEGHYLIGHKGASFFWNLPDRFYPDEKQSLENLTSLSLKFYLPPWAADLSPFWSFIDTRDFFIHGSRKIHGFFRLSDGYSLAFVPRHAKVIPIIDSTQTPAEGNISNSYSLPKALVALVQLCFACFTLSRNSTSEIKDNGYGAYSLTVVPFALMSFLNLLGLLLNPSYPTLFMIRSEMMEEAISRGSVFDGVVGRLVNSTTEIASIDENKISGCFKHNSLEPEVAHVLPTGWDRQEAGDGRQLYINQTDRKATWTQPKLETVVEETVQKPVLMFTPEYLSSAEAVAQLGAILKTVSSNPYRQIAASREASARYAEENRVYRIDEGSLDVEEEPSLFIPLCPGFERIDGIQYRSEINQSMRLRLWTSTYWFRDLSKQRETALGKRSVTLVSLILGLVTFAIVGAFTKFSKGQSPPQQRVVFMLWISIGLYLGGGWHNTLGMFTRRPIAIALLLGLLVWLVPVGLGFWEVAQAMIAYGTCVWHH